MSAPDHHGAEVPVGTDPESVERAVRYLEWWLPIGSPGIGSATVDAVRTLVRFARERGSGDG